MSKTLAICLVFAACLIGAGLYAYSNAPEGANAATALIVPSACAAVMLLLGGLAALSQRSGKLGAARKLHFGAVLMTVVFASLFAWRAAQANKVSNEHQSAVARWTADVQRGERPDDPAAMKAWLAEQRVPDHSKQYLANTLWTLCFIGAGVFVALLVTRPGNRPQTPANPSPN